MQLFVVQHAQKQRSAGDPGLTDLGRRQAGALAERLAEASVAAVWSSPLRRALETAMPIAVRLGLSVQVDARLRERMNWDGPTSQSLASFLADWDRATRDRTFVPRSGDSSDEAGRRFAECLEDIAHGPASPVAVVAHGGVTVDGLRTLFGDDEVRRWAPSIVEDGVPPGAVTQLTTDRGRWELRSLAEVAHLPRSRPGARPGGDPGPPWPWMFGL